MVREATYFHSFENILTSNQRRIPGICESAGVALPITILDILIILMSNIYGGLMSDLQRQMYFDAMKKSMGVAYLLWFFLGGFGAHRFYLGRTGSATFIVLCTLLSIPLMFIFVGFVTIFISAFWVLIDLFLIPGMVDDHNMKLIRQLTLPASTPYSPAANTARPVTR
jgi:TM2 domain-containing membrane protein YozV